MGGSLFIFNGSSKAENDQETVLGLPDDSEAKDLVRHVDRCSMRYKLLRATQLAQGSSISQIKFLIYGLILFVVATSHPAQELWQFLAQATK